MRDRHGESKEQRHWKRDMGRPRDMLRNMGNDKNRDKKRGRKVDRERARRGERQREATGDQGQGGHGQWGRGGGRKKNNRKIFRKPDPSQGLTSSTLTPPPPSRARWMVPGGPSPP